MSKPVKIPKGWIKLRPRQLKREGDKYWHTGAGGGWYETGDAGRPGLKRVGTWTTYIRALPVWTSVRIA